MEIFYNNEEQKLYLARWGYNAVFGYDVDYRERMNREEALTRFETVWADKLLVEISQAKNVDSEIAFEKLNPNQQRFFKKDQEHREFKLDNGLFVAQLHKQSSQIFELTQLWFIPSTDYDPRVLYVKFDNQPERDKFSESALQSSYKDTDNLLGKLLLQDFIAHLDNPEWQKILTRIKTKGS